MDTSDVIAVGALALSVLSLAASVAFAAVGRRHTRTQIAQADAQAAELRSQFDALNTPDVDVRIRTRLNPPEERGVWAEVTNNHPTIAVTDLTVSVDCRSAARPHSSYGFVFLLPDQVGPLQQVSERSPSTTDGALRYLYDDDVPRQAILTEHASAGSEQIPVQVRYGFLPRRHGAERVQREKQIYLEVYPGGP